MSTVIYSAQRDAQAGGIPAAPHGRYGGAGAGLRKEPDEGRARAARGASVGHATACQFKAQMNDWKARLWRR